MRTLYSGESHMDALTAVIEGFPAGFFVDESRINKDLFRRQQGYGRGSRMQIEADKVQIISGIIEGITIGSPITLAVANKDNRRNSWDKDSTQTIPRPGHADLTGSQKYNLKDMRLVSERSSARHTASITAAGSLFRQFLEEFEIHILGFVGGIGGETSLIPEDPFSLRDTIENSQFRTCSPKSDELFKQKIDEAASKGDTLGGTICVVIRGCPAGLGSYVHPDRRLDAMLASAFMGIPSVKGVEIGRGFESAALSGSQMHDIPQVYEDRIIRRSNNAGGIEGGISNGEDIVIRAAAKPIPTLRNPLPSIDMKTGKPSSAPLVRGDVTAVPAISIVAEAAAAEVICRCFLERYGRDHMKQIKNAFKFDNYSLAASHCKKVELKKQS